MYLFYLLANTLGLMALIWSVQSLIKNKHEIELVILYAMTIIASLGIVIISAWVISGAGN